MGHTGCTKPKPLSRSKQHYQHCEQAALRMDPQASARVSYTALTSAVIDSAFHARLGSSAARFLKCVLHADRCFVPNMRPAANCARPQYHQYIMSLLCMSSGGAARIRSVGSRAPDNSAGLARGEACGGCYGHCAHVPEVLVHSRCIHTNDELPRRCAFPESLEQRPGGSSVRFCTRWR
jgi:hypothetical protein